MSLRALENELASKGYLHIAGVDEAGRGPLAGPVVASSVVLHLQKDIKGVADSKSLKMQQRELLYEKITSQAISYGIGIVSAAKIDEINILQATFIAMRSAICQLSIEPDFILVDGRAPIPNLKIKQLAKIKGDKHCYCIAAASILAKVTRDRIMLKMHEKFPAYNFAKHKGYGTSEHLYALKRYGPCAIHRKSFKGVKELCQKQELIPADGERGKPRNI
ncbi:MAG: ribonuclease HII [bacterium]